jgi:hypothetical protein
MLGMRLSDCRLEISKRFWRFGAPRHDDLDRLLYQVGSPTLCKPSLDGVGHAD